LARAQRKPSPRHPGFHEESRDVFSIPLYDAQSCATIVEYIKGLDGWSSAQVRFEVGHEEFASAERPDDRIAKILESAQANEICAQFDDKMDSVIKPLIRQICGVNFTEHSGTQILRYPPGGHYVPHQDAGSDLLDRYFTVVCYLNEDFEGGHTRFPSLKHSVVPQRGKAVVFPSRFFHCAEPVIRGEKFVIISWLNGPTPLRWI
jgi:Rps23 Pro-64 3,4-dihydroxylase Tpa1-like proline 4-hydroxylase